MKNYDMTSLAYETGIFSGVCFVIASDPEMMADLSASGFDDKDMDVLRESLKKLAEVFYKEIKCSHP